MKKAKKILVLALSACLLVAVTIGATVAYLTAEDEVVNTFTVGNVQIELNETDVKPDGTKDTDERVDANTYHLLPGHTYTKDPTVKVLATSEECYVKMTVTIDKASELDAIFAPDGATLTDIFNDYNPAKWIAKGDTKDANTRTYEFWYYDVVDASEEDKPLEALFSSITVPGTITGKQLATIDGMTITVNAYAIQADGFADDKEAWEAFSEAK